MKTKDIETAFFAIAEIKRLQTTIDLISQDEQTLPVLSIDRGAFRHAIKLDRQTANRLFHAEMQKHKGTLVSLGVED